MKLTRSSRRLLLAFKGRKSATLTALSAALSRSKPTACRACQRLVALGYAYRVQLDHHLVFALLPEGLTLRDRLTDATGRSGRDSTLGGRKPLSRPLNGKSARAAPSRRAARSRSAKAESRKLKAEMSCP